MLDTVGSLSIRFRTLSVLEVLHRAFDQSSIGKPTAPTRK